LIKVGMRPAEPPNASQKVSGASWEGDPTMPSQMRRELDAHASGVKTGGEKPPVTVLDFWKWKGVSATLSCESHQSRF
jgi:hypothetical protein